MWAFGRESLQDSLELQHVCGDSAGDRNSRIVKNKFIFKELLGDRMVISFPDFSTLGYLEL